MQAIRRDAIGRPEQAPQRGRDDDAALGPLAARTRRTTRHRGPRGAGLHRRRAPVMVGSSRSQRVARDLGRHRRPHLQPLEGVRPGTGRDQGVEDPRPRRLSAPETTAPRGRRSAMVRRRPLRLRRRQDDRARRHSRQAHGREPRAIDGIGHMTPARGSSHHRTNRRNVTHARPGLARRALRGKPPPPARRRLSDARLRDRGGRRRPGSLDPPEPHRHERRRQPAGLADDGRRAGLPQHAAIAPDAPRGVPRDPPPGSRS